MRDAQAEMTLDAATKLPGMELNWANSMLAIAIDGARSSISSVAPHIDMAVAPRSGKWT